MSEENNLEKDIDTAIHQARKLQEEIFNFKNTPNDIFKLTTGVISSLELVSKQIREENNK